VSANEFAWALAPEAIGYARTLLRLLHFAGLVLGLGGAVFLDLTLGRVAKAGLTLDHVDMVEWIGRFVALGLAVLWLSGLGFLALYQVADPQKLANPKIYAKMVIVAILTANGIVIHLAVLPRLRQRIDRPLMADLRPRLRLLFAVTSAVSLVSWTTPVVLGAAPQLNVIVPFAAILTVYAALLVAATALAFTLFGGQPAPKALHANNNNPPDATVSSEQAGMGAWAPSPADRSSSPLFVE
jgi:hypothetical protein